MADSPYDTLAKQCIEDEPHYAASVTAMSDHTEVCATEDILAANGAKLVAQGTRISSELRDKLVRHKLLRPIDASLSVRESVTPDSLARDANKLLADNASLKHLTNRSLDPLAMQHGLARLVLPPQMAFKLTVAREERPALYAHLLTVALLANYFSLRLGFSARDTTDLVAAALYHDLGELHTDPALLDPGHKISAQERHFIYVHPITGYLIVKGAGHASSAVLSAILQHHERLDGSGYPYGLKLEKISRFAQILGICDVAASIFSRPGESSRFATLLRLNRNKYDKTLMAILQEGLATVQDHPLAADVQIVGKLQSMATLLDAWGAFRTSFTSTTEAVPPASIQFLFDRMFALRSHMLEFGFDPDSLEALIQLVQSDATVAAELVTVMQELHWQLADLAHEVERNRDAVTAMAAEKRDALNQWLEQVQHFLSDTPPPAPSPEAAGDD